MTIERRLTTPDRRDALRDKRIELAILLFDGQSETWRAYGCFPGGAEEFRISSPVGNGSTASAAVDDLLRMKVSVAKGLHVAAWALGDAMADLADTIKLDNPWIERCTMGVGCDEAGACYAAAHGEPSQCPKA